MKPSIEQVWQALMKIHRRSATRQISIDQIIEDLDEHVDNILPSLLFLAKERRIKIDTDKTNITVVKG